LGHPFGNLTLLPKLLKLTALFISVAVCAVGAGMIFRPALGDAVFLSAKEPTEFKPGELRAQFFGTSTILIGDGKAALLIDGFFSRPAWWRLVALPLAPDDSRISDAMSRGKISNVDAVFVAHSHHDHALDSARVAGMTKAMLYGSNSTLNIARGERLPPEKMRLIQPGKPIQIGEFTITAFEALHSPGAVFPGTINEPLALPARLASFKEGENYIFHFQHSRGNVLVIPSANFVPGALAGVKADVVFLGIGGLGKQSDEFTRAYWEETILRTGAKCVIPVHWDDFGIALDRPLEAMPFLMDRVDTSLDRLGKLANANKIELKLPRSFVHFSLP
jgi:L-ascorbate metabolism protein UlaG (beta-lactamase superfamily)